MKKEFNDFIKYLNDNVEAVKYDTLAPMRNSFYEAANLSQKDIEIITKISYHQTVALLRHYHLWLNDNTHSPE